MTLSIVIMPKIENDPKKIVKTFSNIPRYLWAFLGATAFSRTTLDTVSYHLSDLDTHHIYFNYIIKD
jgi:hypothetical protein